MADRLVEWISDQSWGKELQLQHPLSDYGKPAATDDVDEACYVADEDYFDDASVNGSWKPQAAQTELSTVSILSQ